jgi:hypothetical protein
MDQAEQSYPSSAERLFILYDLHCPGATEHLYTMRDGWGDLAHVEYWDAQYAMLVIRPGGALGACR